MNTTQHFFSEVVKFLPILGRCRIRQEKFNVVLSEVRSIIRIRTRNAELRINANAPKT